MFPVYVYVITLIVGILIGAAYAQLTWDEEKELSKMSENNNVS